MAGAVDGTRRLAPAERPAGAQPGRPRAPGRWLAPWLAPWLIVLALLPPQTAVGADRLPPPSADAVRRGQALYETGQRWNGQPIAAQREGFGPVAAAEAACTACHRRSAMGDREAGLLAPALAGDRLFRAESRRSFQRAFQGLEREQLRAHTRPAYTPALLGRALREGLDPADRRLHAAMPRYALDDRDVDDLIAYLRDLGQRPIPGAQGGRLHLASVLTPDADPAVVRSVQAGVAAWARQLKLGDWQVHWTPWPLSGPASGWRAQLEQRWRAQPVFALISGAGGSQWQPVENFCETHQVACLLPSLERLPPPPAQGRHHSAYFSAGVVAEAGLLAAAWTSEGWPQQPVVNCVVGEPGALAAEQAGADALARLLAAAGARVQPCHGTPQAVAAQLSRLQPGPADAPRGRADAVQPVAHAGTASAQPVAHPGMASAQPLVVLWARPAAVDALVRLHALGTLPRLVSAQLAPPHRLTLPADWRAHTRWLSLQADPEYRAAGASMSLALWSRDLGLPADLDPVALGEAHAATFFFTDALARMREGFSIDYLLERFEGAVDRRPAGSVYYRLALGPGQRVAAQHGRILGYRAGQPDRLVPLTPLLRVAEP